MNTYGKGLTPALRTALDLHSYKARLAAVRATLQGGIAAVSADQLFPTPAALAERMVREADLRPGDRILEPEAGTAAILRAIGAANVPGVQLVAVEIVQTLADHLRRLYPHIEVICADFRNAPNLGTFDRILMNPPFSKGQDVKHVCHALPLLHPKGRLVSVMLNDGQAFRPELSGEDGHGRHAQRVQELRAQVEAQGRCMSVEELPPDSFASQGTRVRTVLVTVE